MREKKDTLVNSPELDWISDGPPVKHRGKSHFGGTTCHPPVHPNTAARFYYAPSVP